MQVIKGTNLVGSYGLAAIEVKCLSATNTKGTRLKAISQAGTLTVGRDYSLDWNDNAWEAARALIEKLEWNGNWRMGHLVNGNVVFVREVTE